MAFWATLFSTKKDSAPAPALDTLRTQIYRADCTAMQVLKRKSPGVFAVRPLADGLVEALVSQRGDTESVLRWDVVKAFGKPEDELFALGAAQGAARTKVVTQDFEFAVQMMASNDFYLSALLLQSFARSKHQHGVLFAPISWHHWVVHVVQASTLPPIVAMMAMLSREASKGMRVAEYEALTGDLYWYKPDGVIEKLELAGEGADVHARSAELQQAMDAAFRAHMDRPR